MTISTVQACREFTQKFLPFLCVRARPRYAEGIWAKSKMLVFFWWISTWTLHIWMHFKMFSVYFICSEFQKIACTNTNVLVKILPHKQQKKSFNKKLSEGNTCASKIFYCNKLKRTNKKKDSINLPSALFQYSHQWKKLNWIHFEFHISKGTQGESVIISMTLASI